jgi:HAE1 family hydrophobic/amphiphilic exporter-1
MQWLAELSVRRAVFASVLMLAVVVVGTAGYMQLGVDAFPKIDFPVVSIVTTLDGAAPEEVETQISEKIEAAVNTISGVDELRSVSSDGVSQVLVTFNLDKPLDPAAQDVRDHVSTALPDLPKGIDAPVVQKLDPDAAPILYVSLTGPGSLRSLTEIADKRVRRDIENTPGVGQVSLVGGRKRQINVWLNTQALGAYELTPADVQRAILQQNLSAPGGSLLTGPRDLTLRVQARVQSPRALERIVVQQRGDHAVRLADVATVSDGEEELATSAALNDESALILSIRKQSGENTVAVVESLRERLAEIEKTLPAGFALKVVRDASRTIQTQVDAVKEHLMLGAVFAVLIVLVFLGNWRSTLIAALAIPISIIGTFALMWMKGFTLNIITLLALALAVGIVIDDAIVVLENIYRFIHEKKMKPFPAAIAATKDIGLAVLATTLSLIAVFLPVAFMSGIVGRFLNSFGLTMAFAIGVSLFVSFTITPMLAARWLDPPKPQGAEKNRLERFVDGFYLPIERLYMKMLGLAMAYRWVVVVACFGALGSTVPLFKIVQKGFLPPNDEANFEVNIRAPEGTSLEATQIIAQRIAREVRRVPGVSYTLSTIGDNKQKTPNLAKIYVKLIDPIDREASQADLVARTRREVAAKQPANLRIDISDVQAFDSGNSSKLVQYIVNGPDLDVLSKISDRVVAKLRQVPAAVDADTSMVVGKPEAQLHILRDKAADLGVSVADIASAVQLLVGGLKVSSYEEAGEDYDIRIRAPKAGRADVGQLGMLTVPSTKNRTVLLRDVVTVSEVPGPSEINRLNRRRQVTISSNVLAGHGEAEVSGALEQILNDEHLPAGYRWSASGRSKESGRAGKAFLTAFALSLIFMYLILAAQFESWIHPLTILISLPLVVPFAVLSLVLFGQSINIQSALGLLVLFGVVKKNSILQVDHTNNLRAAGMPRYEAIMTANKDRLRPILMTTIAFVAGMIPLITAKGIGAGFNRATAGIVVGGQTFSLLLTLLATPVVYSLLDDLANWTGRLWKGKPVDRGASEIDGMPSGH